LYLTLEDVKNKKYDELSKWINTHNKLPSSNSTNYIERKLGMMCTQLRSYKRKGKLSEEIIEYLKEIKYWYWDK